MKKNPIFLVYVFWSMLSYGQSEKINFDNFTVENGLSHNYIHCIFQDHKGWIWLGTSLGIERFDGYKFKEYGLWLGDTIEKQELVVRSFFENKKGELLACFEDYGIGIYNREMDIFLPFTIHDQKILSEYSVKSIDEDKNGNLWVATKTGFHFVDVTTGKITSYINDPTNTNSLENNYVRKIKVDKTSKIWLGTQSGLNVFDPVKNSFIRFSKYTPLFEDEIWEILIDSDQKVWVGTFKNGVVIVNPLDFSFKNFVPDKNYDRSYTVRAIMQDKNNNFWIGTRGGLYFYNPKENVSKLYKNNVLEINSLVHNSVFNIHEDLKGDLWIGTRGGLSYLVKEKQVFKHYRSNPGNNNYLNDNEIYCFWIDDEGKLWCGTESGGVNILNRKTGTFEYITTENGLSRNCIKAILPDGYGNILIGTYQGGLNVYNPVSKKIKCHMHNQQFKNSISGNIVWDVVSDKKGNIWVGTDKGLDRYDPESGSFEHITHTGNMKGIAWISVDNDNDLWLGLEDIRVFRPNHGIIGTFKEKGRNFFIDSEGQYWISTEDKGIALYDKQKGPLKYYNENSGLANNLSFCIVEDNDHFLWISTANGLSRFNPADETFKKFDKMDGLQGNQFGYGAGYKSVDGEIFFGGTNGFSIFNPENIIENNYIPPVYITDFKIFNQKVKISDEKGSILQKSISESDLLEIPYKYNVLTFEFAALNYANSKKNTYKYILEGFDNDWTETVEQRTVTYTNLNPGEYVFKVTGSNGNGYWSPAGDEVKIKILPPLYRTWGFRILSFLIIALFILLLFIFILKRKHLKNSLLFEKEKAIKLQELDMFKFRFFTNISHEIKTPLTLIISPLEKMLRLNPGMDEIKKNHLIMHRNARQLLGLVTQLLDYQKLEDGKLKLELEKGDIVKFTENILNSFSNIMNDKNIKYFFKSVQKEIITLFDADKFEKIVNNLISNAVKYTEQSGTVSVFLSMVIDDDSDNEKGEGRYIKILVRDNGIGIQEKNIDNIFKRFYSYSANNHQDGTGIGLAFTKELVQLLKGKIFVESKPGKGSSFTVLLPYIDEISDEKHDSISEKKLLNDNSEDENEFNSNKQILLVVEDNSDVRSFIKSHFEKEYLVKDAENGKAGLDLALKIIPDAIISDVMMPVMSGVDMCEKLKKDERTSHIPIVLLTVLSSKQNVMEGLLKGADDYITKPFDIVLLQTKIENLLLLRKSLREKYLNELVLKPSNITITSPDEQFLQKALKIVEKNISDPGLDIEKFVSQIGISRMQLYRKMAALTNMTVKEFINDIRLKRAAQMLGENKLTISEIAYSVGFNDISYFGKCFRKKYGMSASEFGKPKITHN